MDATHHIENTAPARALAASGSKLPGIDQDGCLHELFESCVDLFGDSPALISEDETLTYAQLENRANRLAHWLRSREIGAGDLVGIYLERSTRPIIALLGCLKAGAAYVPIDRGLPDERIRHICTEAKLAMILSEGALASRAATLFDGLVLDLAAPSSDHALSPTSRLDRAITGVTPFDLCYVIYTSGTTGKPKGVMTEHRNAHHFVLAFNDICATTPEDRIFQGFALSFDGSVEEIWMAFSNGAALVVGSKDTPRFGNELATFMNKHEINYFSTVPTLLSTITVDIPSLTQIVVSGEVCPTELAARWTRPGRLMLNVYGPTEATVNTTAFECRAGAEITIGRPIRGYSAHILDEGLNPVAPGHKGELFVGGRGVARGYLHRPDLSAERFVALTLPGAEEERLYRTGDLVRVNNAGELEFFGRIDAQVKIRGYRVELAEIEAVLLEVKGVQAATVKLFEADGLQELAAYVLLEEGAILDRDELLAKLSAKLPDYMIPAYLDVLTEFPRLTSGKVDRNQLPSPAMPLVRSVAEIVPPATPMEKILADAWTALFRLPEVSVTQDFFLDLGGHSLLAAQLVTRLREESGFDVATRDIYRLPTVRRLGEYLGQRARVDLLSMAKSANETSAKEVYDSTPVATIAATTFLQAASLYAIFALGSMPFVLILFLAYDVYDGLDSLRFAAIAGIGVAIAAWPVMLVVSIAAKWLLIGRYKPGRHRLWGFFYFRWWLVTRLQNLAMPGALAGTPFMALYGRLMGANIGRRVMLDTAGGRIWDLLSIGDDSSIGADTQFLGYRVEQGMLRLDRVDIGARCFVGIHSAFGLGARMEDDARLDDQSFVPDGDTIPAGEGRRGSPAKPGFVNVPAPGPSACDARRVLYGCVQVALSVVLAILLIAPGLAVSFGTFASFWYLSTAWFVASLIVAVPVGFVATALWIVALKKAILNRSTPGVYSTESFFYLRKWLVDELMKASRVLLLPLYTTMYLPTWLRLMGAKIGRMAELSTVWYCAPDLMELGEQSFFADGSIVGGKRFFGGRVEIARNRVGRRSFVGNSAILPVGAGLGNSCLLGVLSAPPREQRTTADGTDWLGSPAFALPHRQKVTGFDDSVTYMPTRRLLAERAVIDALRILIPGYLGLLAAVALIAAVVELRARFGVEITLLLSPFVTIALGALVALAVVGLKRLVMGTFKPVIRPLWSRYVWLNEMINGIYESVMSPFLAAFLGTPFVAPFLRMIGCRIGKHAFIETTLFSEFDLVEVGDYAALNLGAIIQTHLFEDRIMKSSHLKVGAECSVGNMAVMLYDAEMRPKSALRPLSLLMKGETLDALTPWHGIPSIRARTN